MDTTLVIGDIVERDTSANKSSDFAEIPVSASGFPRHKKRWQASAFKQQRADRTGGASLAAAKKKPLSNSPAVGKDADTSDNTFEDIERRRIDHENRQRLDQMSPEEIAQAQDDLMSGLNPALVQRLLQRANIDEPADAASGELRGHDEAATQQEAPEITIEDTSQSDSPKTKQPNLPGAAPSSISSKKIDEKYDEDKEPPQIPPNLFPITNPPKSTHFPVPPRLPDLDPSDPNFLETLHSKYFPDLPADPSKLAWMAPLPSMDSPADKDSSYYPHPEISLTALRFDFRGRFLSPRVSRSVPSSKGLHHHGEAPEAAGYTIGELARLARSAVPAQRCVAFQTLGRVLYRLGKGEWGGGEDTPVANGTWAAIKQGKVLETLMEAAANPGGHQSSRAYATEALWLFEKGGWREKFKGR